MTDSIIVPETITLRDQLRGHQANLPDEIVGRLFRMRHVAVFHHDLENRKSGEPYHEHCLAVEDIVRQVLSRCPDHLKSLFGEEEQEAACGHDLFEACLESGNCDEVRDELTSRFSARVIFLIEALTKYDKVLYWEQLYDANEQDPWVIIIKIADRLHNLRTIRSFTLAKQQDYLHETLGPLLDLCNRCLEWARQNWPEFVTLYEPLIAQLQETAEQELERVELELESTSVAV